MTTVQASIEKMNRGAKKEPTLCFIMGKTAYFTDRSVFEQLGDDWDDAPYEHNAGPPSSGIGKTVNFSGPLKTPADIIKSGFNRGLSVLEINQGVMPWLTGSRKKGNEVRTVKIMAGVSIPEFVRLVQSVGGKASINN